MALNHSPKIVTDGLVLYYDMTNGKSFKGGPVTNLLPSPSINGYPTIGNGWSTYNTNQYNGATYFSIGTISSVSSNIVTTSTAHPLRSYDVVTPQTTGGGVTAGTNYLVKKLSSTTFSLHTWNSSQDGSQGYINPATGTHKVYDDFANNVQISINVTSFPTMWWGPPHLPNSGLVKEIITGGFNGKVGITATDCVRLHFIRPDNVTDGMAYGPDAPVTPGVAHTVSFWTRSVTASAVGNYLAYQIYNYGTTPATGYYYNAVLGPVGVWTKHQLTFTPANQTCISYWFPNTGSMKCDVANIQFETGSVANNFTPGTRSTVQAIVDIAGNNTLTASSLTYANDETFSFNGSNSVIYGGASTNYLPMPNFTLECWHKCTGITSGNSTSSPWGLTYGITGNIYSDGSTNYRTYNSDTSSTFSSISSTGINLIGAWHHVVYVVGTTTTYLYIDGILNASSSNSGTWSGTNTWAAMQLQIGNNPNNIGYNFLGSIGVAKIYNRALSATEVKQNFQALRGRYSL